MDSTMEDISHREIYDRLIAVEHKVDTISTDTKDVVNAFNSAKGAFLVFEWIGKLAKPIIWLVGLSTIILAAYERLKNHP
jgi:hypothetical protein